MKKNNLVLALVAGFAASVIGAALWAGIAVVSGFQIGFVAIGIGALTGFAVQFAGKGDSVIFSAVAAAFGVFGCLLGNIFTVIGTVFKMGTLGFMQTLQEIPYGEMVGLLISSSSPVDLLFYGFAGYFGWKYAISENHIDYDQYDPINDDQNGGAPPVFGPGSNQ